MMKQRGRPKKLRVADGEVKLGFDSQTIALRLDQIMALKTVSVVARNSEKYKQIFASIREVGIIEPPVVTVDKKIPGKFILLDGHMRIEALKELGEKDVTCLISTDDESYTYNKHVNRLSTIQEHRMILQAVKRGVKEEKIAQALNLDVQSIVKKRTLIDGICAEAVDMLKDKMVPAAVFAVLKKMKAFRQIEAVTLMNDARTYTTSYAKALLAATPKEQLTDPEKPKNIKGLDDDQMARMESEMHSLQREYKMIEQNYGKDILNLTLAKTYLSSLLDNSRIVRFLHQHHPEMLSQFQKIADMDSLEKDAA
jgi:RepB plasmid partitioning protein/ParB-like nuclease domain